MVCPICFGQKNTLTKGFFFKTEKLQITSLNCIFNILGAEDKCNSKAQWNEGSCCFPESRALTELQRLVTNKKNFNKCGAGSSIEERLFIERAVWSCVMLPGPKVETVLHLVTTCGNDTTKLGAMSFGNPGMWVLNKWGVHPAFALWLET